MRKCKVNLADGFRTGIVVDGIIMTRIACRGMIYQTNCSQRRDPKWLLRWVKMCLLADVQGDKDRALCMTFVLASARF